MEKSKTIRQAKATDLENLAQLFDAYRCFYGKNSDIPLAMRFLSERMLNNESVIYVAEENDRLIGFTQLYATFSSVSAKRAWILNDLYVHQEHRQHGVGKSLIQAALEYAHETGAAWVSLQTGVGNIQAQVLYKSMGFKKDEDFFVYSFAFDYS